MVLCLTIYFMSLIHYFILWIFQHSCTHYLVEMLRLDTRSQGAFVSSLAKEDKMDEKNQISLNEY